jgi:hypothetical protein
MGELEKVEIAMRSDVCGGRRWEMGEMAYMRVATRHDRCRDYGLTDRQKLRRTL